MSATSWNAILFPSGDQVGRPAVVTRVDSLTAYTVDGIKVWQSKDGKHEIRQWTDSLRKLVRKELERSNSDWVFTNRSGKPWSMSAIQSAMRRLEVSWTFHDLRAKADSDHETGLGLMRRYNRARRLRAVK